MNKDSYTPMPLRFTTSGCLDGPPPKHYEKERDYLENYRLPKFSARTEEALISSETVFWTILFASSLVGIYLSFRTF